MIRLALAFTALLQAPTTGQQPAQRAADVVIFPLAADTRDPALAALADSCVTRLAARLHDQGLTVVRRPASARSDVRRSRVARFAIDGTIERTAGTYSVALRLLDAATEEELRSYFYSGKEPAELYHSGEMLAGRVVKVVREP